jgi:hypothetical protein
MKAPTYSNTYYSPCELPSFTYAPTLSQAIGDALKMLAEPSNTLDQAHVMRIEDTGKLTPILSYELTPGGRIVQRDEPGGIVTAVFRIWDGVPIRIAS